MSTVFMLDNVYIKMCVCELIYLTYSWRLRHWKPVVCILHNLYIQNIPLHYLRFLGLTTRPIF